MECNGETHGEKVIRKYHNYVAYHSHDTAYDKHFLPPENVCQNSRGYLENKACDVEHCLGDADIHKVVAPCRKYCYPCSRKGQISQH